MRVEETATMEAARGRSELPPTQPHTREDGRKLTVIEPRSARALADLGELADYRDLLYYLVRRDLVVRYVQTVLGLGWGILQPLVTMVIFTIFFGHLAKVRSEGVPYALFSLAALVPWTYFANGVNAAGNSVVSSSTMVSKVYFPRLFIPLSPLLAVFVDFLVALGVLFIVMAAYAQPPTAAAAVLPLLVAIMLCATIGTGLWLAALGSRYRDVRYATPFVVQILLFVTPVIYAASVVPKPARYVYALNPMVCVVDGFRSGLLGTGPLAWSLVGIGAVSALALLVSGVSYFSRTARYFADLA